MKPASFIEQNAVLAKDQPEYLPLPVHVVDEPEGRIISCWSLSVRERLQLLFTGRIWLTQMTFNQRLQPQLLELRSPFKPVKGEG